MIRLRPRRTDSPPLLQQVVRASFGQRRKTLQRALAARFDGARVAAALGAAGIDGGLRAERLSVAQFVALAEALAEGIDGEPRR